MSADEACPSPDFVETFEMIEETGEDDPLDETTGTNHHHHHHHLVDMEDCKDNDPDCAEWASSSECDTNPTYMLENCRFSCGACDDYSNEEENTDDEPPQWERSESSARMGVRQVLDTEGLEITKREIETAIQLALIYYDDYVANNDGIDDCRNTDELCAVWAALGECSLNPNFMDVDCAPLCHSCDESQME